MRRELERSQIERQEVLPPSRPLNELDRALPGGPLQDLAAVHRIVAQLKRRLATQGQEQRGRKRHAHVDVRRTMRASLQTGGVPVELRFRPRRPRRPEIYVLCDVSTSVTSASMFFLSVLHALHDSFRKLRSFVFIERISEVTDIFERERSFKAVSEAIGRDAGVADISGYTDYGRVWSEFLLSVEDELHPRATVIVLGDARTNGRDPRADLFAAVAGAAGSKPVASHVRPSITVAASASPLATAASATSPRSSTSRLPNSNVSMFEPEWNTSLARITPAASAPTSTSAVRLSWPSRRSCARRSTPVVNRTTAASAPSGAAKPSPSATTRPGNVAVPAA